MPELDRRRGVATLTLDAPEADVVRQLIRQMRALLRSDDPEDAVLGRLFPDAYEDPDEARAYKELVGDDLAATKLGVLDRVAEQLGDTGGATVPLDQDALEAWLIALTDMRLALGTRLEVTEQSMSEEVERDEPDAPGRAVLHWLGWMQELMLEGAAR